METPATATYFSNPASLYCASTMRYAVTVAPASTFFTTTSALSSAVGLSAASSSAREVTDIPRTIAIAITKARIFFIFFIFSFLSFCLALAFCLQFPFVYPFYVSFVLRNARCVQMFRMSLHPCPGMLPRPARLTDPAVRIRPFRYTCIRPPPAGTAAETSRCFRFFFNLSAPPPHVYIYIRSGPPPSSAAFRRSNTSRFQFRRNWGVRKGRCSVWSE